MKPLSCFRSTELRHVQAPLSHDQQRHIASCDVCRETWLIALALKSLAAQTSEVATSETDVARILVLAKAATERKREVRYRQLGSGLFVFCLMAWAAAVGYEPGLLRVSGSVLALLAAAIVAVLWASSGSQTHPVASSPATLPGPAPR